MTTKAATWRAKAREELSALADCRYQETTSIESPSDCTTVEDYIEWLTVILKEADAYGVTLELDEVQTVRAIGPEQAADDPPEVAYPEPARMEPCWHRGGGQ